jgi:hypothetical protein
MGFIPIILTLSGAITLFFIAVHNSLKSKKTQILGLQADMIKAFSQLDLDSKISAIGDWNSITKKYLELKKKQESDPIPDFDETFTKPFHQAKILKSQYNSLISKKPYSFVALLMGHKTMV